MTDKLILDATAGTRMMWFDKNNPHVVFFDKDDDTQIRARLLKYNRLCGNQKRRLWNPKNKTVCGTWDKLPFDDETFQIVVFDPPHLLRLGKNSKFRLIFGELHAETWQSNFKKAFKELWRVLKPNGILILKWSIADISLKSLFSVFPIKPLFGQVSSGIRSAPSRDISSYGKQKQHKSFWFCFMKIPE